MPFTLVGEHYTISEVAEMMGITVQGVHKAIKEGRIKARMIAGVKFIAKDELQKGGDGYDI